MKTLQKDRIKNLLQTYFIYTLVFIVFFICVFSPFLLYGKAFLWQSDGMSQHYPTLLYTKEWTEKIVDEVFHNTGSMQIPMWETKMGLGQDISGNAVAMRPINFLYVLFPNSSIEFYLVFRGLISLYISGLAFLFYVRTKNKSVMPNIIGALIYVFCGFSIFFTARHSFFLEMTIFLPLLFYGVDRTFERNYSWMFILSIFMTAISNYYFLYMVTIPTVIYAFFVFFEVFPKGSRSVKSFFVILLKFSWQFVLGICMSAFAMLPTLYRIINSSRLSVSKGSSLFFWEPDFYMNLFRGIIDPVQIGQYGFIALSGIAFFSILYLIFDKENRKQSLIGQHIVYALIFLVPVLTSVFSGFTGKTLRWNFAYAFIVALTVVHVLPALLEKKPKALIKSTVVTCIYLVIHVLISIYQGKSVGSVGMIGIIIALVVLVVINTLDLKKKHYNAIWIFLLIFLCFEITLKSYNMFSFKGQNDIAAFVNSNEVERTGWDNPVTIFKSEVKDDSMYRVDSVVVPLLRRFVQMNYGLRNGVNGLSSYYSLNDDKICRYSLELGNAQQNVPFLILNFDQRAGLNALSSVKYLMTTQSSDFLVPYGYTLLASQKGSLDASKEIEYLYKNDLFLPLMYVYDSYVPYNVYEDLSSNEKEQAMLQGVVLEDEVDYPKTRLHFDNKVVLSKEEILSQIRENYQDDSSIEVFDDRIVIKKPNTKITLDVEFDNIGEIYWIMEDVAINAIYYEKEDLERDKVGLSRYDYLKKKAEIEKKRPITTSIITVFMGKTYNTVTLLKDTHQYYFGKRDVLINLGYRKPTKFIVNFSETGDYTFSNLKLVCQPTDLYQERIDKLRRVPVSNIKVDVNDVFAEVTTDKEKYLCIALPYSSGWSATINGNNVPIVSANGMYMAVKTVPGVNKLVMTYRTPGMALGNKVSIASIILFIVIAIVFPIYDVIKKKKNK